MGDRRKGRRKEDELLAVRMSVRRPRGGRRGRRGPRHRVASEPPAVPEGLNPMDEFWEDEEVAVKDEADEAGVAAAAVANMADGLGQNGLGDNAVSFFGHFLWIVSWLMV